MSAPVKNTCPDIDKVVDAIASAYSMARDARIAFSKETEVDASGIFNDIENELYGLTRTLEDLRTDNGSLRDWGHELDKELEEAANQIADLETEKEELREDVEKLKAQIEQLEKELSELA